MFDKNGKSGSFNESVIIPPDVNIVVLGIDRKQIWTRGNN